MLDDLNRSSSSLSAEYLSGVGALCSFVEDTGGLGFLFMGGRVVLGGLARGSEKVGLVTHTDTL